MWRFYDAGDGKYYIKNKLGYYLDVAGGGSADGTNVQVYSFNKSAAQKWGLAKVTDNICQIHTALNENLVLDVSGSGKTNGTNIIIYTDYNQNNQQFSIAHYQAGWYAILSLDSGKALDVAGGAKGSGVNVQLYEQNMSDAQLWCFIDAGEGFYYIKNKLGYFLDAAGGTGVDGTNVQVYSMNHTPAQKWEIELISSQHYHEDETYFTEVKTLTFDSFSSWQAAIRAAETSIANYATAAGGSYNTNAFIVQKQPLEWKSIKEKVSINTPGYYQAVTFELPSKIKYTYHKHALTLEYYLKSDSILTVQQCKCGERLESTWTIPWFESQKFKVDYRQFTIWKPRFYY